LIFKDLLLKKSYNLYFSERQIGKNYTTCKELKVKQKQK